MAFYGFIALLHAFGLGLYLRDAPSHPALAGLGLAAYLLGLRHSFDADHIAAVDDTVRYLMQKGRQPLGVGFFFSLGHSTVVLLMSIAVAFAAVAVRERLPALTDVGGLIGAAVSGTFLWIVGLLNLSVLLRILGVGRQAADEAHRHEHVERLLRQRGFRRLFGGRLRKMIEHSWQMYPLGLLFGLGFDTASEVALLGMAAGASTGDVPIAGILSLPLLFAAGMSLMDTTDGVLMVKAYDWALREPSRRLFYNIGTTSLSIAVALGIGTVELLQVAAHLSDLHGVAFDAVRQFDLGLFGYAIVALFLLAWVLSVLAWHFERRRQRASAAYPPRPSCIKSTA